MKIITSLDRHTPVLQYQ